MTDRHQTPSSDPRSDGELLRAWVASRDHGAFQAIVDRYEADLTRRVGRRLARCPPLQGSVSDIVQETFIALARVARELAAGGRPLGAWLRCVAARRAIDQLRQYRHRPTAASGFAAEEDVLAAIASDPGETPSDVADAVRACWDELPPKLRAVIDRKYLDDAQQTEIAEELGLSNGTISRRLEEAREWLRSCLQTRLSRGQYPGGGRP